MNTIQHSDEQMQAMRRDYEQGMSLMFVAEKYHVCHMTARDRIIKAGGTIRPKNAPWCNIGDLIRDYNSGVHIDEITEKHMYADTHSTYMVLMRLKRKGYKIINKDQRRALARRSA